MLIHLAARPQVLTPFLPGDSLLFAAGAFAALGSLHLPSLMGIFTTAAILGDAVNYAAGHYLGAQHALRLLTMTPLTGPRTIMQHHSAGASRNKIATAQNREDP